MNNHTVGITGATGFVGSALVAAFRQKGTAVIPLVRKPQDKNDRLFDLTGPISPDLLTSIDILILCAFISPKDKNAAQLDLAGTLALIELARKSKVKKIIYFSTVSAHPGTTSSYGRSKFNMEALLDTGKDAIVKPGLIIGKGGLFYRMLKQALSKKFIPLIGDGMQPMQVIAIEDVVTAVMRIIEKNLSGTFILANEENFSYKEMFQKIAAAGKVIFRFLPIPAYPLKMAVSIGSFIGIPLPVNKENISGLESLEYMDSSNSLELLNIKPRSFEEALQEILRS